MNIQPIVLLLLAVALSGCKSDTICFQNYANLDRAYIPYQAGEQRIFLSPSGELDTLVVEEMKIEPLTYYSLTCTLQTNTLSCLMRSNRRNGASPVRIRFESREFIPPSGMEVSVEGAGLLLFSGAEGNAQLRYLADTLISGQRFLNNVQVVCKDNSCGPFRRLIMTQYQGLVAYEADGVAWVKKP